MEGTGDFPDGPSKPVYGDDHEVIAFTEPAHALRPAGSVATSATGRGVGEHPVGGDPSRRDGVVLLIDGLLPGGPLAALGVCHSPSLRLSAMMKMSAAAQRMPQAQHGFWQRSR